MVINSDTVHGRIKRARIELTLTQVALGLALAALLGFTLLFLQDPLAHEAMHGFRHAAGITCH